MSWRERPYFPGEFVSVIWGFERVEFRIRELMTRVPSGTPGAIKDSGRWWLLSQVVYAPGAPKRVVSMACEYTGLSAALSWMASQWNL